MKTIHEMTPSPFPELNYAYAVAGFHILTNQPVQELDVFTGTDGAVQVVFTRAQKDLPEPNHLSGNIEFDGAWHHLPDSNQVPAVFRSDGRVVLIQEPETGTLDYGAQLRRVIPFAAALQNRLVLHGAAVGWRREAISFIGASGAGKSTVAKELIALGCKPVADDLLPCRIDGDQVYVPVSDSRGILSPGLPMDRVYFLVRDDSPSRLQLTKLSRPDCFIALIQHGFGELPVAEVWKTQFTNYHKIAERVPAFQLKIPVGLDHLKEAVQTLVKRHF